MYRHTFCPLPRTPGGGAKKCVIAHPIDVSNLHIKFGWILSIGLEGDNVSIGRTDGGDYNIILSLHTPTQDPCGGFRRSKQFFTENSHAAYQIKGNRT